MLLTRQGTRIEGNVILDAISRIHGVVVGEIKAPKGSKLILSQNAAVEGTIHADTVLIDGYVRGNILASGKVVISRTGRVVGDIKASSLVMEFGAYFEGRCNPSDTTVPTATSDLEAGPA